MAERLDALVVGGGIIGLAAARALAKAGKSVCLLERGVPGQEASGASAGMLACQVEGHAGAALLTFGVLARERHLVLAAECAADGHPYAIATSGIVAVALDDARLHELEGEAKAQQSMGLDARMLSRVELIRLQPGIARECKGALLLPKDGCVDNVAMCAALHASAEMHGARIVRDEVTELLREGRRAVGVKTAASRFQAGVVVIAAGAWSDRIHSMPRRLPVEPVRGQMAEVPWPAGEPRNILFGPEGYIVPRLDRALLGATMEYVGYDKANTDEGLAAVRRGTAALMPAFARVKFARTWAGLRPVTPDGLPILGFDPDVDGLLYATGHGRNGVLLAPITGEIVCDLVVHGETSRDISPYSITRFG